MGRNACIFAALLLHATVASTAVLAAGAKPGPALATSAIVRGDPVLVDLYRARDFQPWWTGSRQAEARRAAVLALLASERQAEPAGADAAKLAAAFQPAKKADPLQAELGLTRAALDYLARRRGDDAVPAARVLRALASLDGASVSPPLALAVTELDLVRELGGWREVGTVPGLAPTAPPLAVVSPEVDVAPAFPPRKRLPEVGSLRQRLVQSADLSVRDLHGTEMDDRLTDAVRRFQKRHGLVPDGVVGARTLEALNTPVRQQIGQVRINLARPAVNRAGLPRYVEVNVPGYELRLVEQGRVVLRSRVIVGDEDSPTPIFDDRIRYIEVNPSWYVPQSITKELLDKERKKPGYLDKNGFYWRASAEGAPLDRLVQRPGPENALGRIKFLFPNHHSVYLHDTPQRGLFGRSQRSLSHGCIRVEKPYELALALLGRQGWDASRLDAAFASEKTRRVDLAESVPVFLDYRTAFVDDEGRLNLRPDLYGHDAGGVIVFKGKGLPPDVPPAPVPTSEPLPEPLVLRSASQSPVAPARTPAAALPPDESQPPPS
jgi:lipoprotein-anchoring transpeptidase ErfK/SrfK